MEETRLAAVAIVVRRSMRQSAINLCGVQISTMQSTRLDGLCKSDLDLIVLSMLQIISLRFVRMFYFTCIAGFFSLGEVT